MGVYVVSGRTVDDYAVHFNSFHKTDSYRQGPDTHSHWNLKITYYVVCKQETKFVPRAECSSSSKCNILLP
jgi:hypothetical protein